MKPKNTRNLHFILKTLTIFFLFLFLLKGNAQTSNSKYNKQLADSLGADDYGMKTYILVVLKSGKTKIQDKKKSDSLLLGHLQNITKLAALGKLITAGPLKKNDKEYAGIFVLNVNTFEEANELLETDPAIKAKMFDTELFQWYSSAALPLYLQFHDNVKKKNF